MGTCLDLLNLEFRTWSTPAAGSKSDRSRLRASPIRSPVTANKPINVSWVVARNGDRNRAAAAISAEISASV